MQSDVLSTWWREPHFGPRDILRAHEAAGARGSVLDASLTEELAIACLQEMGEARWSVPALAAPFRPGPGRRRPRLATGDRDERRAAVRTVQRLLRRSDCPSRVILELGRLPDDSWARLVRDFQEGALAPARVQKLLARRAQQTELARDQARFGLEPLLEQAASAGVTLLLCNRPRPFDIPDDAEILGLLDELDGAPLGIWLDPAAAHARMLLETSPVSPVQILGPQAAGAWLADASGLLGGLPWSRGEVDTDAVHRALPAGALWVHHVAAHVRASELALGADE